MLNFVQIHKIVYKCTTAMVIISYDLAILTCKSWREHSNLTCNASRLGKFNFLGTDPIFRS